MLYVLIITDVPDEENVNADGNSPVLDAGFDPDKTLYCSVESQTVLIHGAGGRGYGLGNTSITSGTSQYDCLNRKLQP